MIVNWRSDRFVRSIICSSGPPKPQPRAAVPRASSLNYCRRACYIFSSVMYDDFTAVDRWSGEPIHCTYQAVVVAIATRHADAIDIKFLAGSRPVRIALPHLAWVRYKE